MPEQYSVRRHWHVFRRSCTFRYSFNCNSDTNRRVDTLQSSFSAKYMLHLRWNDTRLAWNTSSLEVTVVETKSIWYPRLAQYSDMGLDESYSTEGIGRMIQIFSDGTVYWQLTSSSVGMCRVTTRYFPYDKHRCGIVFSPESYLNIFFRRMFDEPIISSYSTQSPSWRMTHKMAYVFPYDFFNDFTRYETPIKAGFLSSTRA